ncbi:hypothetical protein KR222_004340, partial [Zaprionus bogoriensis]
QSESLDGSFQLIVSPSPSYFLVLFWRIAMQLLYPHGFIDNSLEEVLGDDTIVWVRTERMSKKIMLQALMRETLQKLLLVVMIMEAL